MWNILSQLALRVGRVSVRYTIECAPLLHSTPTHTAQAGTIGVLSSFCQFRLQIMFLMMPIEIVSMNILPHLYPPCLYCKAVPNILSYSYAIIYTCTIGMRAHR